MKGKKVKKYKNLSYATGFLLITLVIVFYLISILLSAKIFKQVESIKEHPFPVVTSAGGIESSVYQMRTLTERLIYIRNDEVIRNVRTHYEEIEKKCTPLAQQVVEKYLVDPSESREMQKTFYKLMESQYIFLEICSNSETTSQDVNEYIDSKLNPLMDKLQTYLSSIIFNAMNRFDRFTAEARLYRNFIIIASSILAVGVILSIFIYLFILNRKEKEQEHLMADMEVALAASQTANSAKSKFLSNVSHDIRTPMNAIIGMTAIACTCIDNPSHVKDCLDKISSSSKLLLGIINNVLDMSKIESGKIIINEEAFNLSDLFHSVTNTVRPQIASKKQSLNIALSGVKNEEVLGDSLRLQHILMNLLSNAMKFTPVHGEIKIKLLQESSIYSEYVNYIFVVSDNGIGMGEDFAKNIFNPFEREKNSTVSKIEGTGLGLAIVKNLVEMMGGHITVESKLNVGTTFTVTIPLKTIKSDSGESSEILRGLRVLIVDDEQDVCENTAAILKDLGMEGEWVLRGDEAIERVAKNYKTGAGYHAVILDWKMPEMDGVETTRQIRKIVGKDTPIIILTAYDWSEIKDEAHEAGVSAFLEKPLFKSRLKNAMLHVLQEDAPGEKEDSAQVYEKSGMVLIVEDNEINIEIIKTIIESFGIETEIARDGQQAVDIIKALPDDYFDLILMDIQMPVMDGYTASKEIRSFEEKNSKKPIPIIALSANAFADDILKAKSVKIDDYLTKPINLDRLKKRLDKYLK